MTIEIPEELKKEEFAFVLVERRGKKAVELGWTTKIHRFDDPVLISHLKSGGNYGVLCGHNNLLVVDFDNEDVQNEVCQKLPKTLTILTGSGKLHKYFHCEDVTSFNVNSATNDRLADIQGKGRQVIAPNSIHPNGNVYTIIDNSPIADIEYGELKAIFSNWQVDIITTDKKEGWIPIKRDPNSIIEQIKINLLVSQVLSGMGIPVDRNPTLCPFHESKGGKCLSFDDMKGVWHCFHCNKGGSIYELYMYKEDVPFSEAIEVLASQAGMTEQYNADKEKWGKKETESDLPEIPLPVTGKLISTFASESIEHIKDRHELFYRYREFRVQKLEMTPIKDVMERDVKVLGFKEIAPSELVTYLEKYIIPVLRVYDQKKKKMRSVKKSITSELAKILLMSSQFTNNLPLIDKIYEAPLPMLSENQLVFPKEGYDERFQSWLPFGSPTIDPMMSLEEATKIIKTIFAEFCFETPQDEVNAISALLTPFIRGLYSRETCRTPIFFYKANRERAGKDYCAEITGIVMQGVANSEPPLSDGKETHDEEFRKKILATFRLGKNRLHMSNNKGFLNSAVLEFISTNENFSDRVLGSNTTLTFPNTIELSLSANTGITYTPDLANRCVFINLFLELENPNERNFDKPDLHGWVKEHRSEVLSALYALVRNWHEKGMPAGKTRFASYPEWARVCGGIMMCANLGDPCVPNVDLINIGGDQETNDMKKLFELVFAKWGSQPILKKELMNVMANGEEEEFREIFGFIDWANEHSARILFSKILDKYVGRVFSGIQLVRIENNQAFRRKYVWQKYEKRGVGFVSHVSVFTPPLTIYDSDLRGMTERENTNSTNTHSQLISQKEELIAGNDQAPLSLKDAILTYLTYHSHAIMSDLQLELGADFDQICEVVDSLKSAGEIVENPSGTIRRLV